MRLRDIFWACLAGLAVSALLHSAALAFATLTAAVIATLVTASRRGVFRGFAFERIPSRRVVSWGGELDVTLTVTNDKLLPLVWLRVRDEWPVGMEPLGFTLSPIAHLGRQVSVQTLSLRWYERLRRHQRVRCVQRGLHRLGPVELQAGDPFGIAGVDLGLEARQEFVVLPKVLDIPAFDLVAGRPLVEDVARRSLARDPTALRGTRPYREGDALRAVNWRATARLGALHTNEFDPASLAAVRLLMDAGSLFKPWEGIDPELMELLCVVVASLADAYAARGYAVGLASNACLTHEWRAADLPPANGGLPDVLETLARLRPYTARDYGSILAAELADEAAASDCVVVTAALRPPVRTILARLSAERRTTVVFVGRPGAAEAPFVDAVVPADFDWRTSDALPLHP